MNNVISLRPDPLRNLYELIDKIHDTNPTPEQKRITDEALSLVQQMIEDRESNYSFDSEALAASQRIMRLMYRPAPIGGYPQLQAQVQCVVIDAMKWANPDRGNYGDPTLPVA
ncbi:hypothetical protein ACRPHP_07190 [Pantoea allii]|uniref:hypothetical protein n=1 Tax=Pantoea allii TaxID=574096 RepID=UPI003D7B1C10